MSYGETPLIECPYCDVKGVSVRLMLAHAERCAEGKPIRPGRRPPRGAERPSRERGEVHP